MKSYWVQTLWNIPSDKMWNSVLNAHVYVTDCQFLLYSCESVHISTNTGNLFSFATAVSASVQRTPCSMYKKMGSVPFFAQEHSPYFIEVHTTLCQMASQLLHRSSKNFSTTPVMRDESTNYKQRCVLEPASHLITNQLYKSNSVA